MFIDKIYVTKSINKWTIFLNSRNIHSSHLYPHVHIIYLLFYFIFLFNYFATHSELQAKEKR